MKANEASVYGIIPRIYVILRGGLGNQLHQIAAAVKIAEKTGAKVRIFSHIVDTSITQNRQGYYRHVDLLSLFGYTEIKDVNRVEDILIRILIRFSEWKRLVHLQNDVSFNPNSPYRFQFLSGWFQSYEYIPSGTNFKYLAQSTGLEIQNNTVHIRLGDFLGLGLDHVTPKYYEHAFHALFKTSNLTPIYCFSDDINTAFSYLPRGYPIVFPELNRVLNPVELLFQLSKSRLFISSKSSLSWWAANAVSANGGTVVSPWIDELSNSTWISVPIK